MYLRSNGWPARYLAHNVPCDTTRHNVFIPLIASPLSVFWFLFVAVSCFCFCLLCGWFLCFVLGVDVSFYISGTTSYGFGTTSTRSLLRLASFAAISTASKHLHNDLAKVIKA